MIHEQRQSTVSRTPIPRPYVINYEVWDYDDETPVERREIFVNAYTAEDALTQLRIQVEADIDVQEYKVLKIAPAPQLGELPNTSPLPR